VPRHSVRWSKEAPVSGNTKRDDPAPAKGKGLKITHQIREVDPGQPGAADLHRRQIKAMARIIRQATVVRIEQEEAQDPGG
jgi:hypothetical protein